MELPSFGRGPEYGQEVFVLARDGEASLRARRGDIQWLEESDILGRDHYMFLSCDIPEVIIFFLCILLLLLNCLFNSVVFL